ncbi:MAG: TonB family protein [Candidatus Obscuribacterales bacterium]
MHKPLAAWLTLTLLSMNAQPLRTYANDEIPNLSAEALAKEASVSVSKSDLKNAVVAAAKAADLDPDDTEAQDALVTVWVEALKNNPLDPANHIGLGKAFQLRGDFGQAEQEYQQAIRFSPGKNNPVASRLLQVLPDAMRFEKAKRAKREEIIKPFVLATKEKLEKNWHPPQHRGLLITKQKIKVDPTGAIIKTEVLIPSGVANEDASVSDVFKTTPLPALPAGLKFAELYLSFMSDGSMNMVEVSTSDGRPLHAMPLSQTIPEPKDVDFGPYMADLQRRVKREWFPPKGNERKRVRVEFTVDRSGAVSNVVIKDSSGLPEADQAALKAVKSAAPFKALPNGAKDHIDLNFTFDYNVFSGGGHAAPLKK